PSNRVDVARAGLLLDALLGEGPWLDQIGSTSQLEHDYIVERHTRKATTRRSTSRGRAHAHWRCVYVCKGMRWLSTTGEQRRLVSCSPLREKRCRLLGHSAKTAKRHLLNLHFSLGLARLGIERLHLHFAIGLVLFGRFRLLHGLQALHAADADGVARVRAVGVPQDGQPRLQQAHLVRVHIFKHGHPRSPRMPPMPAPMGPANPRAPASCDPARAPPMPPATGLLPPCPDVVDELPRPAPGWTIPA